MTVFIPVKQHYPHLTFYCIQSTNNQLVEYLYLSQYLHPQKAELILNQYREFKLTNNIRTSATSNCKSPFFIGKLVLYLLNNKHGLWLLSDTSPQRNTHWDVCVINNVLILKIYLRHKIYTKYNRCVSAFSFLTFRYLNIM